MGVPVTLQALVEGPVGVGVDAPRADDRAQRPVIEIGRVVGEGPLPLVERVLGLLGPGRGDQASRLGVEVAGGPALRDRRQVDECPGQRADATGLVVGAVQRVALPLGDGALAQVEQYPGAFELAGAPVTLMVEPAETPVDRLDEVALLAGAELCRVEPIEGVDALVDHLERSVHVHGKIVRTGSDKNPGPSRRRCRS